MPFESLSYRHTITVPQFPQRWLPLIHLYDPDLPLFPIYYFHVLPENVAVGDRPTDTQRAFGYVEKINLDDQNNLNVTIVVNKDLSNTINQVYVGPVRNEVCERLGLCNPVRVTDITGALTGLTLANQVLIEIWHRVVANSYDNMLPFGKLWDEVLGLTRFVASWNSPGGRKGELIQTHYFMTRFGEQIQSSGGIPQVDFYLLPTIRELLDRNNPLNSFPKFSDLLAVSDAFQTNYCGVKNLGGAVISRFLNPRGGKFNTEGILSILNGVHMAHQLRPSAIECFNTFDKGPQRTVIYLMLLSDIRNGRLNPAALTAAQMGSIYDGLANTYQSPKAIAIYAQQSFGNPTTMPVDIWIDTFLQWPLAIFPKKNRYEIDLFSLSNNLGKVERLIWVTAQARKVHSRACDDALWCLKYSSSREPRGANPFSCNICLPSIRNVCPAYNLIRDQYIVFNTARTAQDTFEIRTSANNNATPNQRFIRCSGKSIEIDIIDDFSPDDDPGGFAPYPARGHNGQRITVQDFVSIY
jgi:hypothetical protein